MEIRIESVGVAAEIVRRRSTLPGLAGGEAWTRWTLATPDGAPELVGAAACAVRLLTRGPLVPAAPAFERELRRRFGARAAAAVRAAHRVQVAALCATGGVPVRLESDLATDGVFSPAQARGLCAAARDDLAIMLRELAAAGFAAAPETEACFVSFAGAAASGMTRAWTSEGWSDASTSAEPLSWEMPASPPEARALAPLAERLLGVVSERARLEACARLLAGEDDALALEAWDEARATVVLAAMLTPGRAVVLAPASAGRRSWTRAFASVGARAPRLLAPERLDRAEARADLRALAEGEGAALLVVDEAQAGAERGRGFRPAMARAMTRLREWARSPGRRAPLVAFHRGAGAFGYRRLPASVPAPEYRVLRADDGVVPALARLFSGVRRFGPGLVLCEGEARAEALCAELAWSHGLDAEPRLGRRADLLCLPAARAADAGGGPWRLVVHMGMPESREEFLSRLGAAGSAEERILLLCEPSDRVRALERHRREFPGLAVELADAELALGLIGDPTEAGENIVNLPEQDPFALARALWRLEAAGAARLIERRDDGWLIRRLGGTTRDAVLGATRAALERRYGVFEPSRAAALEELWTSARNSASYAANEASQDESFVIAVRRATASALGLR